VFRPAEVTESFDISHRRGIEEDDVEPVEGYDLKINLMH
jgi:hypothetical protein